MNSQATIKWIFYIALSVACVLLITKHSMPAGKEQMMQKSIERITGLHVGSADKSQLAKDVAMLQSVAQLPEADRKQGCAVSTFYAQGAKSVCDDLVRTLGEPDKSFTHPLLAAFAFLGLWWPFSWIVPGFFSRRQ